MSIYLGTTPIADGASTALLSEKANVSLNNLSSGLSNTICTTKATATSSASSAKPAVIKQNYVNGTSWYRIWSDGWIEQGGVSTHTSDANYTVNLLKTMSNTNYTVLVTVSPLASPYTGQVGVDRLVAFNLSTSSFGLRGDTSATMQRHSWYVCGY